MTQGPHHGPIFLSEEATAEPAIRLVRQGEARHAMRRMLAQGIRWALIQSYGLQAGPLTATAVA